MPVDEISCIASRRLWESPQPFTPFTLTSTGMLVATFFAAPIQTDNEIMARRCMAVRLKLIWNADYMQITALSAAHNLARFGTAKDEETRHGTRRRTPVPTRLAQAVE